MLSSFQGRLQSRSAHTLILLTGLFLVVPATQAGSLYVTNYFNNNIEQINSANGADLGTLAGSGGSNPYGLAFDSTGNLYAANYSSNSVEKFAFSGGSLSSTGSTFASSGLSGPTALAFQADAVPEPSRALLLFGGFGVMLLRRRRKMV